MVGRSLKNSMVAGIRRVWRQRSAADYSDPWPVLSPRAALRREFAPRAVLVVAMLGYAILFGLWSLQRFDAFQAPGFDLGIYDQGMWLLSRFKAPFITLLGLNLFGDHASYIMVALVPLYWLWPEPQALLVVQTLALAVGAVPVFLLGRLVFRSSWRALLPAVGYLVTPAVGWLNLENFHPDSFEVPLLLFALYFVARGRWRPYLVMVVLLLTVKEDVPLVLVPLGIYVGLRHNWKVGALTAGLAAGWFGLVFGVLQPLLSGTHAGGLDAWRIPYGGFGGLVRTALRKPWEVLIYMLSLAKLKYLLQLLAPVLFLPLLTARTLIIVPVVLFNLISTFYYQSNLHYHYTSLIIPVMTMMALLATERFARPRIRRSLPILLLLVAMLSAFLWGPVPGSRDPAGYYDPRDPQVVAAAEAVALIPADAVVASRDRFSSHLTHRDQVYLFPTPFSAVYWGDWSLEGQRLPVAEDVEYVLEMPDRLEGKAAAAFSGLAAEGFSPVFEKEGVVLLKREPSAAGDG